MDDEKQNFFHLKGFFLNCSSYINSFNFNEFYFNKTLYSAVISQNGIYIYPIIWLLIKQGQ